MCCFAEVTSVPSAFPLTNQLFLAFRFPLFSALRGHNSEKDEKPPIVEKTVSANKTVCESTFLPAALLLFILYGPFGVAAYGLEISSALSMDTVGIDEQAGAKKSMTQVSIRQSEKKDQETRR